MKLIPDKTSMIKCGFNYSLTLSISWSSKVNSSTTSSILTLGRSSESLSVTAAEIL